MRPMTITTKYQQIRHGSRLAIAIGAVACALVAPAGASAMADYPVSNGVPQAGGDGAFSSLTALSPPSSEPSGPGQQPGSEYSTLSSIEGGVGQAPVSASSSSPSDGFDWNDALVGAGIAAALAFCATAVVVAGRRRTTLSPTA